jgi:exo-1,4-beta-D-glucosaminidase
VEDCIRTRRATTSGAARALLGLALLLIGTASSAGAQEVQVLSDGWQIQSSARAPEGGAAISKADYRSDNWTPASVPSTIVGALVEAKVYPEPYFDMDLRKLPGVTYKVGENFSHVPMERTSPFAVPWWYRRTFDLPADAAAAGRHVFLRFDGINYRAEIWLNGVRIGTPDEVAGAFRRYEMDVTHLARAQANVVAVAVTAPEPNDLAITWVDWNPMPPDRNMGLWQPVEVAVSGPVALRGAQVTTRLSPSLASARLTVSVEAHNADEHARTALVRGTLEHVHFEKRVLLAAGETRRLEFSADTVPGLLLRKPRIWWPYAMGGHPLYEAALEASVEGAVSDRERVSFGVREVTSTVDAKGRRLFHINGRPLLIRGGGWAPDMMLRQTRDRLEAEMRYVREMNLNTVRLEGKLETEAFYEIADRDGILVMPGWCCCDQWEEWKTWTPENRRVAVESLRSQVRRLRNHPSVFTWLTGSDRLPPVDVERAYRDVLREERWPNPIVSSASNVTSPLSGPSGVKMNGPYDYVPPSYWYLDTEKGGANGFDTEVSPGPAIPPIETLKEMIPADHLWPIDEHWLFHAGGQEFSTLDRYNAALDARYGKAKDLNDYVWKSQAMAYEGERAMFEAFGRNKYQATGVIQWMMNNAWPSLIWHLYDYSLRPAGGFYGTRKACEPLHVQYSYDDRSVVVVNERRTASSRLQVTATVYDLDWKERFTRQVTIGVSGLGVARALTLPQAEALPATYFLRLRLHDSAGHEVSRNFYWLSGKPDVLDTANATWFWTPTTSQADLTALASLAPAAVSVRTEAADGTDDERALRVRVQNDADHPAFLVRLRLTEGASGKDVVPVFWEDNYFELAPRETRELRVSYPARVATAPSVVVDGWNVKGNN